MRLLRLLLVLLPFAACLGTAMAQDAALGPDETQVRWVEGRPMLRVTLRAGEKVYYCHLLLDLATSQGLYLHRNAAGSLRAESCDVETGGITLRDVAFTARRDTWLEGLTAEFAEELAQVPVAGILGLSAFPPRDLVLDGPRALLRLLPATAAASEAPPASATLCAVPFLGDAGSGMRLPCDLGNGVAAKLALHTRDPFSWIDPDLAKQAGHPDGVLATAAAAPELDFARFAPFRPLRSEAGGQGGIGGAVLRQMVLTVMPAPRRIVFTMPEQPAYPEVEAEFYRAMFGSDDPARLQQFLAAHGDAKEAGEAAAVLLTRLLERGGAPVDLQQAGLAIVRSAAANKKGTAALEVLEQLPGDRAMYDARAAIAAAGLRDARADEDGNAAHKLRLELGGQLRVLGKRQEARAHLLSAVFGMPASGPANLQLGHWHRDGGELEAALGRYFLAMLDARATGQQGYAAFADTWQKARGTADLLAELEDRADGRVPSFQPIPREPGTVRKTGRTVLVELFTGAMCPPCVAADVACDGLGQYYDRDEVVLLQWHLPVPAPEPLVADASLARAQQYDVHGTPTVVIAGGEGIVGGGKVDAAPDLFRRYREVVDQELQQAPVARIEGTAALRGQTIEGTAVVTPLAAAKAAAWRVHAVLTQQLVVFPGSNGVLFHHDVVRATLLDGAAVKAGEPIALRGDLAAIARELDTRVAGYEQKEPFLVRPVQPDPQRLCIVLFVQDGQRVVHAHVLPLAAEAAK